MFARRSLLLLLCLPLFALAQEKGPSAEKSRKMAAEAMKKADVKDGRIVETDNLLVATELPESKAKVLAASLQRTFAMAAKGLRFEGAETKAMKVIIYTFADLDQFKQFQRTFLKVRPEEDEYAIANLKRDDAFIAVSAHRSDKNPNFERLAGDEICRALLAKKGANAALLGWMKDGYAKAVQWRLNPSSAGADRGAVRRIAPRLGKTSKAPPVADKAWSGTGRERDQVAASVMDFFTFGAGAEKFANILNGLIPTGGAKDPSFADGLKAADWMLEDMDREWRDWVAKGSPLEAAKGK